MKSQRPMIIAHRGASGEAPENTLAAFRLGLEQGCEGIELDVHLSRDGEIVVIHDKTIDRTTDRKGKVNELTIAELRQADAGGWFGEKFAGERIPLLSEVFELAPPEVMINVEIKGAYDRRMESALAELMRRMDRVDNVVVSSFDFRSLQTLKQHLPEAKLGLLYDMNVPRHAAMAGLLDCPVYALHPHFRRLDRDDAEDIRSHGLEVYVYTINEEADLLHAIDCGFSGIITDYPARLKRLLG